MPTLDNPIAFSLFGADIRWYAIFILTGIVAAILVARWLAQRRGMDPDFILDAAPPVVLGAIVGARLYYLLLQADHYVDNPGDAFNVRLGGLTIHGALVAGIAIFAYLCWRRRYRFLVWADFVIAGVPIGQAIGRWGNWANQEAFGTPTDLPWAVTIEPARRPAEYAASSTFHPTFLYEGILDLLIAAALIWIVLHMPRSRWWREGDALWVYFVLYGAARFVIERVRTDSLYIGPLPAAYWLSFGLFFGGLALLALRHTIWPGRVADPYPETTAPLTRPVDSGVTTGETT